MVRMDTRAFRSTLETHGIDREVSDAIVDLVEDSREPFVTNEKLELEFTKHRSEIREEMSGLKTELRGEMGELRAGLHNEVGELRTESKDDRMDLKLQFAQLRTEFAEHRLHTTRLVLGSSGALGVLVIMLRFLPA